MKNLEDEYPFIVNKILTHVETKKRCGSTDTLLDIIMDYCLKNSLDVILVGDAIRSDIYFKSFIEKDCEANGTIKSEIEIDDDW